MAIGDYTINNGSTDGQGLAKFAAGPYTATALFSPAQTNPATGLPYNPLTAYNIGLTQDGWMIGWASMAELLNKTDRYGRALVESFHQGCRMSINCVLHEWRQETVQMITPNSTVAAVGTTSYWQNGIVGSLGTDYAFSLILTARVNTPAYVNGVTSISFPKIKCRSDYDIGMLFGPEHRVIPFMADAFLANQNTGDSIGYYAVSG